MANINTIAAQFTEFYYNTFDTNRAGLQNLYRDNSMLTWEGAQILGQKAILEKLMSLPFEKVQHKVTTLDAQPTNGGTGVLVVITGLLLVDDGTNPLQFSQVFQLKDQQGSFYVENDVFRLNYG